MKHLISTLFFLHFLVCGFAQTNTWQGDVTSNWHTSGNWSLNHVPTSSEDVIIPDVPGFFTPIVSGDALCNNLTINPGAYLDVANTISLGGNYDNNAGSNTSINQITFNGTVIQNVYSLDCETLILDKPDGELRFPSETSTCNNYDWEQGLYRVNGGTFIINDLVDDGIFGTISVTSGQLDIHQDEDQFIDLNCTFFMTDGECNIYGGSDDSWWSYAGNTSITMYNGILDFKDNGINVCISAYSFDENISGGIIKTTGDFVVERENYNPTGGSIWLIGPSDCNIGHPASSNLFHLSISKGSEGYIPKDYKRKYRKTKPYFDTKSNQVIATSDLDLNGDLAIGTCVFTPLNQITVAGVWSNFAGEEAFIEDGIEVIFDGDEQVSIFFSETFHDLTINKSYELGTAVYASLGVTLGVNNDLRILDGSLTLWGESILNVGKDVLIELDAGLNAENPSMLSTIYVAGNWHNNNTSFSSTHGFNPGNSSTHFIGSSDQTIHSNCPDGDFYSVIINSTSTVSPATNLHILDDFSLNHGIFNAPDELYVAGRWFTNPDYEVFNEGTGKVIFNGDEQAYIQLHETFYNVTIDKTYGLPGGFYIASLSSITTINDLTILDGSLEMVNWSYLSVGNNILIESDAGLYITSETNPNINVAGNWQNNNTSFSSTHGFSPGISIVTFNGTSNQTIHSNCPDGDFNSVVINSTSTVSPTTDLHILDDFTIEDGIFNAPAEFYLGGGWTHFPGTGIFNEGTGVVIFDGDQVGFIKWSETFYDVIVDKSFIGENALHLDHSTYINVNNDFQILDGSVYIIANSSITVANDILIELGAGLHASDNLGLPSRIYVGGDWQNNNTIYNLAEGFWPGKSIVEFNGIINQNIISNCPTEDFYSVRINSSASVQCVTNLQLDKIIINGGLFVAPPEIYVGSFWGNNVGEAAFDEGTGLVVFNGSIDAFCHSEEFYHLRIDKPGATLRFPVESTVVHCVGLDWTAGAYELWEGSTFIVDDLIDDGIYGNIIVDSGALLSLTQGTGVLEYVDLNGNLTIDGGEVHVYGGADDSYWTYGGNASITMTDGSLHFNDVGIRIDNNVSYTFSENISGGEIHTASNFNVERDNFTPTSSHLYMNGSEDAEIDIAAGSYLSYLDINKSAKKAGTTNYKKSPRDLIYQNLSKANNVTCISDVYIQDDFTIHNGSFSAPPEMWVRRDWVNNVGEGAFIENTGRVTFFGAVDSEIKYDEVFYDLCNEKDFDVRFLRTAENLNITVLNDLHLNQGVFFTETGNTVEIGNTVQFLEGASWWAGNTAIGIAGDWDNQCTAPGVYSGFRAQNSTVTFNGLADQLLSCDYTIEEFNNLEINNTGSLGNDAFIPNSNVRVTNNLEVIDGHWSDIPDGNAHEFFGDVNVGIDGNWTDPVGIVNLLGPTNKSFYNNGNGYFDVIMFNRDNPTDQVNVGGKLEFNYLNLFTGSVQLAKNNYLNHSAIYVDANGSLNFAAGAGLISDPGAAITIYAGGKIAFNGTNGDNCVVTINGGPGYYYFNIEGEIAAEYTDFSNMAADGISVLPAGSVDPLHAFNNCIFSNGESGGTYLSINSDQNLTCDGAIFQTNSWGGSSNVRKTTDDGEIIFTNYSGDFSGDRL